MTFQDYLRSQDVQNEERVRKVASLRPILYIGLGGFGCTVVRRLKKEIKELVPGHINGFAFLGMDTYPKPLEDILLQNEYVPLSIGVDPNEVARSQPQYLGWYRELVGSSRVKNIQTGANGARVVGRLAFRHNATFEDFLGKLSLAADRLDDFRRDFAMGLPLKVYVISTLAGGTGSGCLLDVLFVVGKFFREIAGADFPYQAILVTPDVLFGEAPKGHMEVLYANTYATLKEVHTFFTSDPNLVVDYDDRRFKRLRLESVLLPDPLHLIGAKNETGKDVAGKIEELADILISYLLSEIQTPMEDQSGQPKVQDKENTYFDAGGHDDMPRAFSSFGVVRIGFPVDLIGSLFTLRLMQTTLQAELRENTDIFNDVSIWLDSHRLKESGEDQLQDLIKNETGRDLLIASVDARGNILQPGYKYDKLVAKCKQYQKEMEKALENEKKKPIDEKGKPIMGRLVSAVQETFDNLLRQKSVGEAILFLQKLEEALKCHREALKQEITECRNILLKLQKEIEISIGGVETAIEGWWGRKRRVGDAISDFEARLESFLNQQIDLWIKEKADEIYSKLLEKCKNVREEHKIVLDTLKGRLKSVETCIIRENLSLDQMADIEKRGPGNRFSLVDSKRAGGLYDELVRPDQSAAIGRIRAQWLKNGHIHDTKSNFEQWLSSASPNILNSEISPKLDKLNFASVFERFYRDDTSKKRIFHDLQFLSSPLFWLDPNRKEPNYDSYWIIAAHPTQKSEFINNRYEEYLPGQGIVYAYFDLPHEVILYQLKYGYTVHSYRGLNAYEADYNRLQEKYREGKANKKPVRPIHSWIEAEEWDDLIPSREAEEAGKWFILGRAFNHLFPTPGAPSPGDRKNVAFLYSRGSNYYLEISGDKGPQLIGKGLAVAFRNFGERMDWQQTLQKRAEEKIAEVGEQIIRERIEKEYLQILDGEIETAKKNPDPQERQRADILRKLKSALETFFREELRISKV
ncbi:MAG: hypothetical protein KG012_17230 [Deltaproteobacteria bacterium]|nr:hypothetical protein [Deltaproteobacteria bacterium]